MHQRYDARLLPFSLLTDAPQLGVGTLYPLNEAQAAAGFAE